MFSNRSFIRTRTGLKGFLGRLARSERVGGARVHERISGAEMARSGMKDAIRARENQDRKPYKCRLKMCLLKILNLSINGLQIARLSVSSSNGVMHHQRRQKLVQCILSLDGYFKDGV